MGTGYFFIFHSVLLLFSWQYSSKTCLIGNGWHKIPGKDKTNWKLTRNCYCLWSLSLWPLYEIFALAIFFLEIFYIHTNIYTYIDYSYRSSLSISPILNKTLSLSLVPLLKSFYTRVFVSNNYCFTSSFHRVVLFTTRLR